MWILDKQPWEGSLCWEGLKNSPRIFDKQTLYNSMEFMKWKSKRWIIQCTQFEKCWALDFGRNLVWWTCCGQKLDWWAKLSGSKWCAQKIYLFSDGVRIKVCPIYFPFLRSVKRPEISDCIFLRSRTVFPLKPGWFQRGIEKKFCCHQLQLAAAGNEDNLEPLCKKQQR